MPSFVLGSPRAYEQFFTNLITAIDNEEPDQIKINGKLIARPPRQGSGNSNAA
jgi:hypothetical protein